MKKWIKRAYSFCFSLKHRLPFTCVFGRGCKIRKTTLEGANVVSSHTVISDSSIGSYTFIGRNCEFPKCKIGKFCSIGDDVKIIHGRHPTKGFVSTYPAFYSAKAQYGFTFVQTSLFEEEKYAENGFFCVIGNDVWIGSFAHILGGISIGNGAIIGCNAVVTKDVPPFAIVAGVPAKIIGFRFSESEIKKLETLKWWDKPFEWLQHRSAFFDSVEALINQIE